MVDDEGFLCMYVYSSAREVTMFDGTVELAPCGWGVTILRRSLAGAGICGTHAPFLYLFLLFVVSRWSVSGGVVGPVDHVEW